MSNPVTKRRQRRTKQRLVRTALFVLRTCLIGLLITAAAFAAVVVVALALTDSMDMVDPVSIPPKLAATSSCTGGQT